VDLPKKKDSGKKSSHFCCKMLYSQKICIGLDKKTQLLLSVFQRFDLYSCSVAEQINLDSIACWNARGGDSHDTSIGIVNTKTNYVSCVCMCVRARFFICVP
jgi:hypothetical protein